MASEVFGLELGSAREVEQRLLGLLDQAHIDEIVERIALRSREMWIDAAEAKLRTSRDLYVQAIGEPQRLDSGHWVVPFTGTNASTAAMIEFGNEEYDMRGVQVEEGQVVAFKTRAIPRPGQQLSPQMQRVQALGRPYAAALGSKRSAQQYGRDIGKLLAQGHRSGPAFEQRAKTSHHLGLYERAQRYDNDGYLTFRTVGEDGWIYPERKGEDVLGTVRRRIGKEIPDIVKAVLEGSG